MSNTTELKGVIISIHPEYCDLILSGEKTIELRKHPPTKLVPPFKCYVYQTGIYVPRKHGGPYAMGRTPGKVVGEFICDRIDRYGYIYRFDNRRYEYMRVDEKLTASAIDYTEICLTEAQLAEYGKKKRLYGWHITNVERYQQPKSLLDFGMIKSPQSWCYLKEGSEDKNGS